LRYGLAVLVRFQEPPATSAVTPTTAKRRGFDEAIPGEARVRAALCLLRAALPAQRAGKTIDFVAALDEALQPFPVRTAFAIDPVFVSLRNEFSTLVLESVTSPAAVTASGGVAAARSQWRQTRGRRLETCSAGASSTSDETLTSLQCAESATRPARCWGPVGRTAAPIPRADG
jgi:hypothetical protein